MRRFSSTVRSGKIRRPSGTRVMPLDTMFVGSLPVISSPSNSILPLFGFTRPAIERSVELLPAPLAPISVTMLPFGTSKEIPLTASMPP